MRYKPKKQQGQWQRRVGERARARNEVQRRAPVASWPRGGSWKRARRFVEATPIEREQIIAKRKRLGAFLLRSYPALPFCRTPGCWNEWMPLDSSYAGNCPGACQERIPRMPSPNYWGC